MTASAINGYRLPSHWGDDLGGLAAYDAAYSALVSPIQVRVDQAQADANQAQANFDRLVNTWQDIADKIFADTSGSRAPNTAFIQNLPSVPLLTNDRFNGAPRYYTITSGTSSDVSPGHIYSLNQINSWADSYRNNANNELTTAKAALDAAKAALNVIKVELDQAKANFESTHSSTRSSIHSAGIPVGVLIEKNLPAPELGKLGEDIRIQIQQLVVNLQGSLLLLISLYINSGAFDESIASIAAQLNTTTKQLDAANAEKQLIASYEIKMKALLDYRDPDGTLADSTMVNVLLGEQSDPNLTDEQREFGHDMWNNFFCLNNRYWDGNEWGYATADHGAFTGDGVHRSTFSIRLGKLKEIYADNAKRKVAQETKITELSGLSDRTSALLNRLESKRQSVVQLQYQVAKGMGETMKNLANGIQ